MPVVRMPNGDLVNFPDSMPPQQISAFIQDKFPTAFAPKKSTIGEEAMRGLKSTGSAYRTALEALIGDKDVATVEGIQRGQEIAEEYGVAPSFEGLGETY